jgi:hypothetical protein
VTLNSFVDPEDMHAFLDLMEGHLPGQGTQKGHIQLIDEPGYEEAVNREASRKVPTRWKRCECGGFICRVTALVSYMRRIQFDCLWAKI